MDHFHEEVVVKQNRVMDNISYYAALLLMVVTGFVALMELSTLFNMVFTQGIGSLGVYWMDLVLGLVSAAIAVLVFLYRDRLRTEYEYTFTNGALDFAQVFNNRKRKSLGSLNVRTVDAFGPVADGKAFQRYVNTPDVKQLRWFLNRGGNLHFFYFQKDNVKKMIIFEPTHELVDMIRKYLPYGVYQE